jgi:plasmid stabilization system protein ParE
VRVRWLRAALRNLDEEAAHIAAEDPAAAQRIVKRILLAVSALPEHPQIGRPGRVLGTRELVVTKTHYLIPYRVKDGEIQVLRVFHTARRPPSRW